jgi:hypothetical protein
MADRDGASRPVLTANPAPILAATTIDLMTNVV